MKELTEESALGQSSNSVKENGLIGHLTFRAAQFLISTDKYEFHQVSCFGYILKKSEVKNEDRLV